ncbi:hypothetical protein SNEBB_008234 [Seison nebaliae]|nr:hypothetical protein SNEBB_008234 [Seison nebaliae]
MSGYKSVAPVKTSVGKNRPGISDRPIRFRCSFQPTVNVVMASRGWVEVANDEPWDIFWADTTIMKECFDQGITDECAKINHFRNHYELTRKNLMVKNLKRHRRQLEKLGSPDTAQCDFYPTTYELPSEYHMFVEEYKKCPETVWIMKPVAKSQGKGIFLFRELKDICEWRRDEYISQFERQQREAEIPKDYVVQKYIDKPFLIGGRKFDLRIYVVVTSYIPLKIWLYREGFARFSNTRYTMESIADTYVHLTNVAVQKTAPDYDAEKGCKWSLKRLRIFLTAIHGRDRINKLMEEIDNVIITSLKSVQKNIINDKHCFELYGYDILLGDDLKAWLVEVNASPSLVHSNQEDYELKYRLLSDVFDVVDMEGKLNGKETKIGGFDLLWLDGPVFSIDSQLNALELQSTQANSFLGCSSLTKTR